MRKLEAGSTTPVTDPERLAGAEDWDRQDWAGEAENDDERLEDSGEHPQPTPVEQVETEAPEGKYRRLRKFLSGVSTRANKTSSKLETMRTPREVAGEAFSKATEKIQDVNTSVKKWEDDTWADLSARVAIKKGKIHAWQETRRATKVAEAKRKEGLRNEAIKGKLIAEIGASRAKIAAEQSRQAALQAQLNAMH